MTRLEYLKQAHTDELTGERCNRKAITRWICNKLDFVPDKAVEIGVLWGAFSGWLMREFPNMFIYGIDPYDSCENTKSGAAAFRYYKITPNKARTRALEIYAAHGSAVLVEKKAADAVADVPDQVDYIFIDGDHAYEAVLSDIQLYLPKIRPGGIMMGHDYGSEKGVVKAVKECFGDQFLFCGWNKGNCWVHPVEP